MADDEASRIAKILQKGFGGVKKAYQHPVTQKVGSGAKTARAKGAGLMDSVAEATEGGIATVSKTMHHGSGLLFILLAFLLYISDLFLTGFNGIDFELFLNTFSFDSFGDYIGVFVNAMVVISLVIYWAFRRPDMREFLSFVVLIILVSVVIFLGGLDLGLIHLLFVVLVYFMFIKSGSKDVATANYVVALLLFLDFFGYGIFTYYLESIAHSSQLGLAPEFANRLLFPVWFLYSLVYAQSHEKNWFTSLLTVGVIGLYIFNFISTVPQINNISAQLTEEQKQEAISFGKKSFENLKETYRKFSTGVRKDVEKRVKYAITGKVEENRYEPLGVYLENVKAAEPRFYTDEKIIVWGNVKARTLDDVVNVDVGCYISKDNKKLPADKVEPDKTFSIFTLEEQDFICEFKENSEAIEVGSNTITTFAEFNFDTLAYLKTYFMDRERLRAMTREELDPFDEFGIKDKKPVAIYTNGPVGIDMSTTAPLIGVSEDSPTSPRLNINLVNRPGWEGKINEIKELVILTPKGIKIAKKEDRTLDCTRTFKEYGIEACKQSCTDFVFNPCLKTSKQSLCKESKVKCESECDDLFEDSEGGYALDITKLKVRDELKDVERFRSFSCKLTINPDEVLENTPITTKFFRARARYDYTVEKKITVNVREPPGAES